MEHLYAVQRHKDRLTRGIDAAKRLLHTERRVSLAEDVPHGYPDKYALAEFLTTAAVRAVVVALERLGLPAEERAKIAAWVHADVPSTVTMRLRVHETCSFKNKVEKEVQHSERKGQVGGVKTIHKVFHKVTTYYWNMGVEYELVAYRGAGREEGDRQLLHRWGREWRGETCSEAPPQPPTRTDPCVGGEVDLTWLLRQLAKEDPAHVVPTVIDRADTTACRTPRRNPAVVSAIDWFQTISRWADTIATTALYAGGRAGSDPMKVIPASAVTPASEAYTPIHPLLEQERGPIDKQIAALTEQAEDNNTATTTGVGAPATPPHHAVLPYSDLDAFMANYAKVLDEALSRVVDAVIGGGCPTAPEAMFAGALGHIRALADDYTTAMDYLEAMLRAQLVAAVGKEATSADFAAYMTFHYRRAFAKAFAPRRMCYAVRQPGQNPVGEVSLEAVEACGDFFAPAGDATPIETFTTCLVDSSHPEFALRIDAATEVQVGGRQYLHAYLPHVFGSEPRRDLRLVAGSRQFGGYIVLLGSITGPQRFAPKHAVLVRNKDELTIPLDAEAVPTAAAFRKSVESISPEMKEFARAYRSMQLEASVFGIAVVQVRPQLERVLNLPKDALEKEIALTSDILDLLVKYNIPTELFAVPKRQSGAPDAPTPVDEQVGTVHTSVAQVKAMLKESEKEELELKRLEVRKARGAPSVSTSSSEFLGDSDDDDEDEDDGMGEDMAFDIDMFSMNFGGGAPRARPEECVARAVLEASVDGEAPTTEATPERPMEDRVPEEGARPAVPSGKATRDITQIPQAIEDALTHGGLDDTLRPTILQPGAVWVKKSAPLLAPPDIRELHGPEQNDERKRAFDLLDALTRSGGITIPDAEIHVVVCMTHVFEDTLMDTVVMRNTNPIDAVEAAALVVAEAVHEVPPVAMLAPSHAARLRAA